MGKIIGIDLGTTNSVFALVEGDEPTVIANKQGSRTTPSVVAFTSKGERLVGQPAKRQAVQNPQHTISSVKRFMGRRAKELTESEQKVPYELVGGGEDIVKLKIGDKLYTPQEISALVLREIKEAAQEYLGEDVTEAVITVPAYFNDAQRQATKDAGAIAGLKVKRIINEPTAAALAYGLQSKKQGKIAVFDLGGGTFDISILDITEVEGETVFEVLSTNGDTRLGGDDYDEALVDYIVAKVKTDEGFDLGKDMQAMQRIREACEGAKRELSSTTTASINLPFIAIDSENNKIHVNEELSRSKFNQIVESINNRLFSPCKQALKDAELSVDDIDEVILVGGSTRIPRVQEIAKEIFGKEPTKQLNPDEVVALGAAVQGQVLADPSAANITFLDVTPLSLGIEIDGGLFHKIVEKNTTIPTKRKETFTTTEDNQDYVNITIYQGERAEAQLNRLLGRFRLDGIRKAPRGVPKIEVHFDINVNGILEVTAVDVDTDKKQKITVESGSGIDKAEIEKLQLDAEKHAEEDRKKRENQQTINDAEQLAYAAQKVVEQYPNEEHLAAKLSELLSLIENKNYADIPEAMRKVESEVVRISNQVEEPERSEEAASTTEQSEQ